MKQTNSQFNQQQMLFQELFVGTLIYAVVLGFFNDYTSIVEADSFSTIFLAAILLETLTLLLLKAKKRVVARFSARSGTHNRILMVFFVWLIMFLSKFVFIWAVNVTFGGSITINGFFGVLFLVVTVTAISTLADKTFNALGKNES